MKLSAVICSRNDNYGGNLLMRSTFCLNSMINTFDEVWYIDWNSPENSLIYEIQNDLEKTGKLHHVIISKEHAETLTRYEHEAQKCCEVLARNIGIRRATGDWIVSTNIDIISPSRDELNKFINTADSNTFYTISRRPAEPSVVSKYKYSEYKDLKIYLDSTVPSRDYKEAINESDKYSLINCCGDFQIANKLIWNEIRGFEESMIYSLFADTNIQKKAIMHGFSLKAALEPALYHINHGKGGGGFLDGINRVTNDSNRFITQFEKTENPETWGFSDIDIEYEII